MALEDDETGMPGTGPSDEDRREILSDDRHLRRDLRDFYTAVNGGWAIPDAIREKAAIRLANIVVKGKDRESILAAKALIAMLKVNHEIAQPAQGEAVKVHIYIPDNGRDQCMSSPSTGIDGESTTKSDPDSGESATSPPGG